MAYEVVDEWPRPMNSKRNGYMYSKAVRASTKKQRGKQDYFPKVALHSSQYHVPTGSLVNPTHFQ